MHPVLHFEHLELECASDELTGCATLSDLGVQPRKLEDYIHHFLYFNPQYVTHRQFGEFPEPPNPPVQYV